MRTGARETRLPPVGGVERGMSMVLDRFGLRGTAPEATVYHAFISYSHAADGKLAPALQRGLQRFAKPWYRPRALRVFRDETSLSVDPALWPSIQQALDRSQHFILLASPQAATSRWVAQEIEHWQEARPTETSAKRRNGVLIGLTDGSIEWDSNRGDFDWERTTALPACLSGAFRQEPGYIDLRWAHNEAQLSLSHPRFRQAVAKLSAAVRGVSPDELEDEAVRQHRRTVRIVRATAAVLTALTVTAIVFGLFALHERDNAQLQARVALSRQVASEATARSTGPLDLRLLLGVQGVSSADTLEARRALLGVLAETPQLSAFIATGDVGSAAFGPGGGVLAAEGGSGVSLWNPHTGARIAQISTDRQVTGIAVSPTRPLLAVADGTEISLWLAAQHPRLLQRVRFGAAVRAIAFSSDGRTFAAAGDRDLGLWPLRGGWYAGRGLISRPKGWTRPSAIVFAPDGGTLAVKPFAAGPVVLYDVGARPIVGRALPDCPPASEAAHIRAGTALAACTDDTVGMAFDPAMPQVLALESNFGTSIWDVQTRRLERFLPGRLNMYAVAFSDDGRTLAAGGDDGVAFWDFPSGRPLPGNWQLAARVTDVAFARTGKTFAAAGVDGVTLWQPRSKSRLMATRAGNAGTLWNAAFDPRGDLLAAGGKRGVAIEDAKTGQLLRLLPGDLVPAAKLGFTKDVLAASTSSGVALWDAHSWRALGTPLVHYGALGEKAPYSLAISDNGSLLAAGYDRDVVLWNPRTGRPVGNPLRYSADTGDQVMLAFSPDDSRLAIVATNGIRLWNVAARRWIGRRLHNPNTSDARDIAFRPDGHTLALGGADDSTRGAGITTLLNVTTGKETGSPLPTPYEVDSVAFSDDGKLLALAGLDGVTIVDVTIVDVTAHQILADTALSPTDPGADVTNVAFDPAEARLIEVGGDSAIRLMDLSQSTWEQTACHVAGRSLTRSEWWQFVGPQWSYSPACHSPSIAQH